MPMATFLRHRGNYHRTEQYANVFRIFFVWSRYAVGPITDRRRPVNKLFVNIFTGYDTPSLTGKIINDNFF